MNFTVQCTHVVCLGTKHDLCCTCVRAHPIIDPVLLFAFPECQVPGTDLEINPTLESLCLSMTEHALGGTTNHSTASSHTTQSQHGVIQRHPITLQRHLVLPNHSAVSPSASQSHCRVIKLLKCTSFILSNMMHYEG